MEIIAVTKGLEALTQTCRVQVFSDSEYVVKAITLGWAQRWKAKNWLMRPTTLRPNTDLWKILLELCEKHEVVMSWVKGHDGNLENERCDQLAQAGARLSDLLPDVGYLGDQGSLPSVGPGIQ